MVKARVTFNSIRADQVPELLVGAAHVALGDVVRPVGLVQKLLVVVQEQMYPSRMAFVRVTFDSTRQRPSGGRAPKA
jgi:hypothetical protein